MPGSRDVFISSFACAMRPHAQGYDPPACLVMTLTAWPHNPSLCDSSLQVHRTHGQGAKSHKLSRDLHLVILWETWGPLSLHRDILPLFVRACYSLSLWRLHGDSESQSLTTIHQLSFFFWLLTALLISPVDRNKVFNVSLPQFPQLSHGTTVGSLTWVHDSSHC